MVRETGRKVCAYCDGLLSVGIWDCETVDIQCLGESKREGPGRYSNADGNVSLYWIELFRAEIFCVFLKLCHCPGH